MITIIPYTLSKYIIPKPQILTNKIIPSIIDDTILRIIIIINITITIITTNCQTYRYYKLIINSLLL